MRREVSKDESKYDEMQETGGELRYDMLLLALKDCYRRQLRDKYRGYKTENRIRKLPL